MVGPPSVAVKFGLGSIIHGIPSHRCNYLSDRVPNGFHTTCPMTRDGHERCSHLLAASGCSSHPNVLWQAVLSDQLYTHTSGGCKRWSAGGYYKGAVEFRWFPCPLLPTTHHTPYSLILPAPMPSCPLCAVDFPALSAGTSCRRCLALQALAVDPDHPNYIQTQVCTA
jgi:hypothetical protein